jgi:uncharacterized membrane protein YcaP (DUF421 family)
LRALAAYWILLIVMRLMGRRGTGAMTPAELIVIFLIGGISVQAIVLDDRSLVNAALATLSIGLMHVVVSSLKQRSPRFGALLDGTPVVLMDRGHFHPERMAALRIQNQDIMASARLQGVRALEDIDFAVVERNGAIAIIPKDRDGEV